MNKPSLRITTLLYTLGIIAIPFSDVSGFSVLGEIQHELSAYLFLAAMVAAACAFITNRQFRSEAIKTLISHTLISRIFLLFITIIFMSLVMNYGNIIEESFRERRAIEKLCTSTVLVLYGFALAYLTFYLAGYKDWHKLIILPITISACVVIVVAVFEYLSLYNDIVSNFYNTLSLLIHSASTKTATVWKAGNGYGMFGWVNLNGRLRSMSFEPAALANYICLALPWILAVYLTRYGKQRITYGILLIALLVTVAMTASRTGMVLLSGGIGVFLLLRNIYFMGHAQKTLNIISLAIVASVVAAIAGIIIYSGTIIEHVSMGENISNLSRLASNITAFNIFADNPIWGVGFGQYGFHAFGYVPEWGWKSYEIRAWFLNPMAVWPPVFSIYARFAAELGSIGVAFWIGLWLWLSWTMIHLTNLNNKHITPAVSWQAYALIISCFCILLSSITADTLRTPMFWIVLGLCCRYIGEMQALCMIKNETKSTVYNHEARQHKKMVMPI